MRALLLLPLALCAPPRVSYSPTYDVTAEYGVEYARALANCTNGTDAATCDAAGFSLTLDRFSPRGGDGTPRPALVLVHGGSYCILNASELWPQAAWFAARGFVAVSINYRLAGDHGLYPPGYDAWAPPFNASGWWGNNWNHMYGAVRDAKAAVRWLRANAAALGVDERAILAYGSSAGACSAIGLGNVFEADYKDELASVDPTLATTHREQSSRVAAVIDHWGAVYAPDAAAFADGVSRYGNASAPTVAYHGLNDTTIVPDNSVWLCDTLRAVGVACALHLFANASHGCWNETVDGRTQDEDALLWLASQGLVSLDDDGLS